MRRRLVRNAKRRTVNDSMSDNQPVKPDGAPLPPAAADTAAIITPAVIADAIADAQRTDPKLAALLMAQRMKREKRR